MRQKVKQYRVETPRVSFDYLDPYNPKVKRRPTPFEDKDPEILDYIPSRKKGIKRQIMEFLVKCRRFKRYLDERFPDD